MSPKVELLRLLLLLIVLLLLLLRLIILLKLLLLLLLLLRRILGHLLHGLLIISLLSGRQMHIVVWRSVVSSSVRIGSVSARVLRRHGLRSVQGQKRVFGQRRLSSRLLSQTRHIRRHLRDRSRSGSRNIRLKKQSLHRLRLLRLRLLRLKKRSLLLLLLLLLMLMLLLLLLLHRGANMFRTLGGRALCGGGGGGGSGSVLFGDGAGTRPLANPALLLVLGTNKLLHLIIVGDTRPRVVVQTVFVVLVDSTVSKLAKKVDLLLGPLVKRHTAHLGNVRAQIPMNTTAPNAHKTAQIR